MGDMDFKIAGTRHGITAVQADVKLPGLPLNIVMDTLLRATEPRQKILEIMARDIRAPREEKPCWPVTDSIEVPLSRRGSLLGPGGITLKRLMAETGVEVRLQITR